MIRYYIFVITFLLFLNNCYAQKENYNWAFGENAGLTWNVLKSYTGKDYFNVSGGDITINNLPSPFKTSMNTFEGCFSVSNYSGKMLFYSDGMTIYKKDHSNSNLEVSTDTHITNGTEMLGNSSSAQSGIIIPYPGNTSHYIAVSLGTHINNVSNDSYLAWSVIKVNDNGESEVLSDKKNIKILPKTGYIYKEIVNAVRAANKKDYWLIVPAREYNTSGSYKNNYLLDVYKVDENGISSSRIEQAPNITSLPTNITATWSSYGQIKFNKEGNRFALITHNRSNNTDKRNNLLIADFDNATGKITILSERSIGNDAEQTYSVEFDHTGQFLYITTIFTSNFPTRYHTLYVFKVSDLINKNSNGQFLISTENLNDYGIKKTILNNSNIFFGSISRGIDNRMYLSEYGTRNMYVITNPDDPIPTDPNKTTNLKIYQLENYLISGTRGRLGLPSYAAFYVRSAIDLETRDVCLNSNLTFTISIQPGEGSENYKKVRIQYGDGNSETIDLPTLDSPFEVSRTHLYSAIDNYNFKVSILNNQDDEIPETISENLVSVNTCVLKVNPHIRINL